MTVDDLFELDEKRTILLRKGDLLTWEKTYNSFNISIENINTGSFWSGQLTSESLSKNDYMRDDRIKIVSTMINRQSKSILNIGVGEGRLEKIINKSLNGARLYGLDITYNGLKLARNKSDFYPICGSIINLPLHHKFSTILVLEVLEHLMFNEIFLAINEIKRCLDKSGELIISVPINENYSSGHNPNGHMRRYSIELIRKELEVSGFRIQEEEVLYAFSNYYQLKKLLSKKILRNKWKPNVVILKAKLAKI